MEIVTGKIQSWEQDGTVLIRAALPDIDRALLRRYEDVAVGFHDGRRISPEQRKKCFSILGEIAEWSMGYRDSATVETVKEQLKMEFITHRQQALAAKMFSLSDTDVSTAKEFISYLIDFCIEWEVPTKEPLFALADDIPRYVYSCLVKKVCCVCGKRGELHHVDRVGMGRNRKEINHIGMKALCLCRVHHMEVHDKGEMEFLGRYHLEPVEIDEKIAKVYRLNRGKKDD